MEKAKNFDWKDSNMANFGSDIEKKIKEAAAQGEPQWKGIGEKVELRVWRIEQFQVKPWPKSKYGKFHVGDSYIVLNSYKPNPRSNRLAHDVHFWIGEESTQDEYGTAAYKTVECDDILGGAAVQHRAIQGSESRLFKSYFDDITYLKGGVNSGFKHVEEEKAREVKMYRIKGVGENVTCDEVKLSITAMNSGDVFILDTEDTIFQWNGKESNKDEKNRASRLIQEIRSTRKSHPKHEVLDEGLTDGHWENAVFWSHLPTQVSRFWIFKKTLEVKEAEKAGKDEMVKPFWPQLWRMNGPKLEKVCNADNIDGEPKIAEDHLDEDDVFILDTGFHVFIWLGDKATRKEKANSFMYANVYLSGNKRPMLLPVTVERPNRLSDEFSSFLYYRQEETCKCSIM